MNMFDFGDVVRVQMPKGVNKRGVVGMTVSSTTWPEASSMAPPARLLASSRAVATGCPVSRGFLQTKNRVAIPWQRQWFRGELD